MPRLTVRRQEGAELILENDVFSIRLPVALFAQTPTVGQTYEITLSPTSPDAPLTRETAHQILNELLTPSP